MVLNFLGLIPALTGLKAGHLPHPPLRSAAASSPWRRTCLEFSCPIRRAHPLRQACRKLRPWPRRSRQGFRPSRSCLRHQPPEGCPNGEPKPKQNGRDNQFHVAERVREGANHERVSLSCCPRAWLLAYSLRSLQHRQRAWWQSAPASLPAPSRPSRSLPTSPGWPW